MPQYLCECCMFETNIKSKLQNHLNTKRHLKICQLVNENGTDNESIDSSNKDLIIEELQKEIMFLKGKVEAYELVLNKINLVAEPVAKPVAKPVAEPIAEPVAKPVAKPVTKPVAEEDAVIINCDDVINAFKDSFSLDTQDELVMESIAMMREEDDQNGVEINEDNVYDCFFHNLKNNLPHLSDFLDIMDGNSHKFSDMLLSDVLPHITIKVTEIYKKRFFIYKDGKKLSVEDSTESLADVFYFLSAYFKSYVRLMSIYFCWDSKLKEFDWNRKSSIQSLVCEKNRKIANCVEVDEEEIPYMLKALN